MFLTQNLVTFTHGVLIVLVSWDYPKYSDRLILLRGYHKRLTCVCVVCMCCMCVRACVHAYVFDISHRQYAHTYVPPVRPLLAKQ